MGWNLSWINIFRNRVHDQTFSYNVVNNDLKTLSSWGERVLGVRGRDDSENCHTHHLPSILRWTGIRDPGWNWPDPVLESEQTKKVIQFFGGGAGTTSLYTPLNLFNNLYNAYFRQLSSVYVWDKKIHLTNISHTVTQGPEKYLLTPFWIFFRRRHIIIFSGLLDLRVLSLLGLKRDRIRIQ